MLDFKSMYQTVNNEVKEVTEKAVNTVYRLYRDEFKTKNNHEEIADMIFEDEAIAAKNVAVASFNVLFSLYEYNSDKVKYFAKMHKCETILEFIKLDKEGEISFYSEKSHNISEVQRVYEKLLENEFLKLYAKRCKH